MSPLGHNYHRTIVVAMQKYGAKWPDDADDLEIEFECIRHGGRWKSPRTGEECGKGLYWHYKQAMSLMWPEDDWHRWAETSLREILKNKVTCFLGCQNSNKTYGSSKYGLTKYMLAPHKTCVLVSSTDVRGLELRVWGKIKWLHAEAKKRYPWLPGHVIDYMHAISTDDLKDAEGKKQGRILNKGIICIPCVQGGKYVGLGKYVGIKAPTKDGTVIFIGDELQFMGPSFLEAVSNIGGAPEFKAILSGNPIDPLDPLGQAAEPKGGWGTHPEPTKTTIWETRFMGGVCVNFVGTDSPNFDYSQNREPKYPYLIHAKRMDEVAAFWGKESARYYEQCIGVMKSGLLHRRVITKDICKNHHASEKAMWKNEQRVRLYACDAAYSGVGGDRCVAGWGEFGEAATGEQILRVNPPQIIPISVSGAKSPEDQIAEYIRDDIMSVEIEPDHVFYDSTGRGTLGISFARVFEYLKKKPVPVEFGGSPSRRPVRYDLFIKDDLRSEKRLKRCDEHFVDKVSELWMVSRYAIEADQIRELPADVIEEGCQREYGTEHGDKTFVESKHTKKFREKMKTSPDLYDWFVTLLEGARQLGFEIRKVGVVLTESNHPEDDWAEQENERFANRLKPYLLQNERLPWAA